MKGEEKGKNAMLGLDFLEQTWNFGNAFIGMDWESEIFKLVICGRVGPSYLLLCILFKAIAWARLFYFFRIDATKYMFGILVESFKIKIFQ